MIIFSDFDGTAAQNDVGRQFFHTFGDQQLCEAVVARWLQDEISSKECYHHETATVRVTPKEFDRYCKSQPLSPGFVEFAGWCHRHELPLIILSDGLDYYIERVLEHAGVEVPFRSNHAELVPPDRIEMSFPFFEHSCGKCANCKRYHVDRANENGRQTVYIGDGFSDRCGAEVADIVLAKGDLARWCEENDIHFHPFEDFHDVMRIISGLRGIND